jgi:hypothetical protein
MAFSAAHMGHAAQPLRAPRGSSSVGGAAPSSAAPRPRAAAPRRAPLAAPPRVAAGHHQRRQQADEGADGAAAAAAAAATARASSIMSEKLYQIRTSSPASSSDSDAPGSGFLSLTSGSYSSYSSYEDAGLEIGGEAGGTMEQEACRLAALADCVAAAGGNLEAKVRGRLGTLVVDCLGRLRLDAALQLEWRVHMISFELHALEISGIRASHPTRHPSSPPQP